MSEEKIIDTLAVRNSAVRIVIVDDGKGNFMAFYAIEKLDGTIEREKDPAVIGEKKEEIIAWAQGKAREMSVGQPRVPKIFPCGICGNDDNEVRRYKSELNIMRVQRVLGDVHALIRDAGSGFENAGSIISELVSKGTAAFSAAKTTGEPPMASPRTGPFEGLSAEQMAFLSVLATKYGRHTKSCPARDDLLGVCNCGWSEIEDAFDVAEDAGGAADGAEDAAAEGVKADV